MRRAAALALVAAACAGRRRLPPWPEDAGPRSREEAPDLSQVTGMVAGGLYMDGTLPFWIDVPAGWRARPGPGDGALRVALVHPATGARVTVHAWPDGPLRPRGEEGCAWTFEDRGDYAGLLVPGEVVVATCVPLDPEAPRVFAWLVERAGRAWQLDLRVPPEHLLAGLEAGEALLATARWSRNAAPAPP